MKPERKSAVAAWHPCHASLSLGVRDRLVRRLTVEDLQKLCDRYNCHWQDLMLVGDSAFIAREVETGPYWEPLLVTDPAVAAAIPELLRRLELPFFESLDTLRDSHDLCDEHRSITNSLVELLREHANGEDPECGGRFHINPDYFNEPVQSIYCSDVSLISSELIRQIRSILLQFPRFWRVGITTDADQGSECKLVCWIDNRPSKNAT